MGHDKDRDLRKSLVGIVHSFDRSINRASSKIGGTQLSFHSQHCDGKERTEIEFIGENAAIIARPISALLGKAGMSTKRHRHGEGKTDRVINAAGSPVEFSEAQRLIRTFAEAAVSREGQARLEGILSFSVSLESAMVCKVWTKFNDPLTGEFDPHITKVTVQPDSPLLERLKNVPGIVTVPYVYTKTDDRTWRDSAGVNRGEGIDILILDKDANDAFIHIASALVTHKIKGAEPTNTHSPKKDIDSNDPLSTSMGDRAHALS